MATPAVLQTYNTDVYGLVRRLNRFIVELSKSQSSAVSKTAVFDVARFKSYITAVMSYMGWVMAQPILDLPETGPRSVDLPVAEKVPGMENESIFDLATLFELARDEIANSQSSRMSTNLTPHDAKRLTDIMTKATAFIDSYITVVDPLDLPESSPMFPSTGGGRVGT